MIQIHSINTGNFKLDGGAMYGVVPKKMWRKLNIPDQNNLCTWSLRCMLIITGNRRVLIDTGIGGNVEDPFLKHFEIHNNSSLEYQLALYGLTPNDITDVLITHFHFDHCGGNMINNAQSKSQLRFPNATYWTNKLHFEWAIDPNPREKASFIKPNFIPLKEHGVLKFIDVHEGVNFCENIDLFFSYGHTEAMIIPRIKYGNQFVYFCADLLPSHTHLGLPYVMSYDIRPLISMKEKQQFLEKVFEENAICFMEHDKDMEAFTIKKNEKGRFIVKTSGALSKLLNTHDA